MAYTDFEFYTVKYGGSGCAGFPTLTVLQTAPVNPSGHYNL